jgi:hypothetical protein
MISHLKRVVRGSAKRFLRAHSSRNCRGGVASVHMRIKGAVPGTNMAAVKFKNVPEGKCMEPSFVPLAQRWNNLAAVRNTDW